MTPRPLSAMLDWLRSGYPDGVPPKDYHPLLALLTRTLGPEELDEAARRLVAERPDLGISLDRVHEEIRRVKAAPPSEEEVRAVAARLAAAGWPLAADRGTDGSAGTAPVLSSSSEADGLPRGDVAAGSDEATEGAPADAGTVRTAQDGGGAYDPFDDGAPPLDRPARLRRVLTWLREGYPDGVPAKDYVPLLALLRRRLTDEEVVQVCCQLVAAEGATGPRTPLSETDARVLITKVTGELPDDADVERVRERLAAHGRPLQA